MRRRPTARRQSWLDDAVGHNEMGAAFIDYNGTAYVVAVFR